MPNELPPDADPSARESVLREFTIETPQFPDVFAWSADEGTDRPKPAVVVQAWRMADEIVRLRAQLAAAEGQARGSEAMLIQAQRDCDNAQNAELVALSQLAEMTTLRDKLAYAERTIEQRNEWINKITRMASDMESSRDAALSLLAERDAQVGRDVKDAQRWRAFVEAEGQLFDYGAGTISAIMTWPESNPEPDAHSEIVAVLTRIVDSHIDAALSDLASAREALGKVRRVEEWMNTAPFPSIEHRIGGGFVACVDGRFLCNTFADGATFAALGAVLSGVPKEQAEASTPGRDTLATGPRATEEGT